jgi:hypothetical protein
MLADWHLSPAEVAGNRGASPLLHPVCSQGTRAEIRQVEADIAAPNAEK